MIVAFAFPANIKRVGVLIILALGMLALMTGYAITLMISLTYVLDPQQYFQFFGDRDPEGARRLVTMLHIAPGMIALLTGPLQFVSAIRRRHPAFHRLTGWLYILSVATSLMAALRLTLDAFGGAANALGFALLGFIWLGTTGAGTWLALSRDKARHRRWMIRSYAITLAAISLRFQIGFLTGLVGMTFERAYAYVAWTSWIPVILLTEVWLRRPDEEPA